MVDLSRAVLTPTNDAVLVLNNITDLNNLTTSILPFNIATTTENSLFQNMQSWPLQSHVMNRKFSGNPKALLCRSFRGTVSHLQRLQIRIITRLSWNFWKLDKKKWTRYFEEMTTLQAHRLISGLMLSQNN